MGLELRRWRQVEQLAEAWTRDDLIPALAVSVVRGGRMLVPRTFGRLRLQPASLPVGPDDRFVVASLTKPLVGLAVLQLVERGALALNDRVVELIPEYDEPGRRPTTIRHLLTHTSGLPDMLPNNLTLRREHAPLERFVEGACGVTLDYPPGRAVQYQSLGFALLGAIVERVSGRALGEFLRSELFDPLMMHDSTLGDPLSDEASAEFPVRLAEIRVPAEMQGGDDWNWNSRYWRGLGAPWGGMVSTAGDMARLCAMMLAGLDGGDPEVLSPWSIAAATTNQLGTLPDLSEVDRRSRGWGLGWRMQWPAHAASFGDLLSPMAFGHWGATGCLFWVDPATHSAAVLLSTQPLERDRSPLVRLSNAVAAALRN